MLKLIKCEFLKLKRKKFIPLIILAAFLFPIPLTYLMTTPSMMERYTDRADAFDGLFNMVLGYGIQFLLPCIIGVIAAILFFMERDNDTFKNLRTIPVTSTQMVLAKIIVLFLFGIVFCVASTIATILCGFGTLEVYGIGYKLFLAVETGIFITAGTLPLIVLVVVLISCYVFGANTQIYIYTDKAIHPRRAYRPPPFYYRIHRKPPPQRLSRSSRFYRPPSGPRMPASETISESR